MIEVIIALVGIAGGGGASLLAAYLFNRRQERGLKVKQKEFIEKLNDSFKAYVNRHPSDEDEVETRREVVTTRVKELSRQIFGKDSPVFESFRLEGSEYPEIWCRWCHRPHQPQNGSRGDCQHCSLPLDVWIGCQSESCGYCGLTPLELDLDS